MTYTTIKLNTQINHKNNLQKKFHHKNTLITLLSLTFILILLLTALISTFNTPSPFVAGINPDITVYNEKDLISAINAEYAIIALGNNIFLENSKLEIPTDKDITLISVGSNDEPEGFWKLTGIVNMETILVNGKLTLGTSKLDGIIVTHATGQNGRGVTVNPSGTLILYSGKISGNMVDSLGGGVYTEGSLAMYGGVIANNSASNGGGVYNNGTFTMSGGLVSANTVASFGGGVYNTGNQQSVGNFTLSGAGIIFGNKADNAGGGVYNTCGNFTLSDNCIIANNTAGSSGGGVFNNIGSSENNSYVFSVSDYVVIANNTAVKGSGGGVYTNGNFMLTGRAVIANNTANGALGTAGGGGGVHVYAGSFSMLGEAVVANNTVNNGSCGGGVYVLFAGSFSMSGQAVVANNSATTGYGGGVGSTGTFEMSGNAMIANNTANGKIGTGGGVYCSGSGYFEMTDNALVTDNTATYGGGVAVSKGLMLDNALVTDNTATYGGGLYFEGPLPFEMSDNTMIANNTATYGGGLYVTYKGPFTVSGNALITGNTATDEGGGVYVADIVSIVWAFFELTDNAVIANNTAYNGGGIYSVGSLKMTSGTITNNTAICNGGGVYVHSVSFILSKGAVSSNVAYGNGGGVWVTDTNDKTDFKKLFVDADVVFEKNLAGGGLYSLDIAEHGDVYNTQIKGVQWTNNLEYGYNNFDISYTHGSSTSHYNVTYDIGDDGTGAIVDENMYNAGDTVTVLNAEPTRAGYAFSGWNYNTKTYFGGNTFTMPAKNIVLMAQWTQNTYVIIYAPGEQGTWKAATETTTGLLYGAKTPTFNGDTTVDHAPGYKFMGWSPTWTSTVSENITYIAQWSVETKYYSITYDGTSYTDGVVPVDERSPYVSGSIALIQSQGSMVKEGYTFLGWDTNPKTNTVLYVEGTSFNIFNDTVLYAVWQQNDNLLTVSYTVHYYLVDSTTLLTLDKIVSDQTIGASVTENAVTIAGYTATTPTTVTATLNATDNMFVFYYTPNTDIEYTVYYYLQGTTNSLAANKIVTGQTMGSSITENAITLSGYTVTGSSSLTTTLNATDNTFVFYYTTNSNSDNNNNNSGDEGAQTKPPTNIAPTLPPNTSSPNISPNIIPPSQPRIGGGCEVGEFLQRWALVNFLLSMAGIILAIIVATCVLLQQQKQEQNQQQKSAQKNIKDKHVSVQNRNEKKTEEIKKQMHRRNLWLITALILGIAGILLFILTEDMTLTMTLVDKWTIVNAIIFIVEIIAIILIFKRKNNKNNPNNNDAKEEKTED
ncbi:MAG: InlB B-repeat-containing protein [Candidatus Bathyarchaeota archaeon]|nr:InlB B-repeat-containing protein [Candidatus Termiticorpusculum sp.]